MEIQLPSFEDLDDNGNYIGPKNKVLIFTNGIPQCPYCERPTERTGGSGSITAAYYPPAYNKDGKNTNPDRNTITSHWGCVECKRSYTTAGNITDGFKYI